MNRTITLLPLVLISGLVGCGPIHSTGATSPKPSNNAITFLQNITTSKTALTLRPDALVRRQMSNYAAPKTNVIVDLPIYPGAAETKPVKAIGDMGTPMNADLVDGTLYFKSSDSISQIKSWYEAQFKKLGYTIGGRGTTGQYGKTTSVYYSFSKKGQHGDPTKYPSISLGFLSKEPNGKTTFKLKAFYIVTPPRPNDSYLPTNIKKVVVTKGKITKTITNQTWIINVVQTINTLQVVTPGITAGGAMAITPGTPTKITAKFYAQDGSTKTVTYSILLKTVQVQNTKVALNGGPYPALQKELESVFKS